MHAQLNTLIDVAPESAAFAEPAQAQMGVTIPVVAVPVGPAFPA